MSNLAAFKIQGTPSADPTTGDRIYQAAVGESLALTLELNPAVNVLTVTYSLFDPNDPSSPAASKSARTWSSALTFLENSLRSITPSDKQGTVHVNMPDGSGTPLPGTGTASWVFRATVLTDSGTIYFDRGVVLNAPAGTQREFVSGEETEFRSHGWQEDLSASSGISASLGLVYVISKGIFTP